MSIISVKDLKKYYSVYKKDPGFLGSVKSLFKRKYTDVKAVDNVSFEIDEGELVGFIGPNGAGKTTTLKCLSGLLYPDNGEINVLGQIPFQRKTTFLKQIALVMGQKNQLWWDLPVMETLLLNKEIYEISDDGFNKTLGDLTELLDAKDLITTPTKKLSLGERMKCELMAALLHSPKVLFLDEPTIGLDVVMQNNLRTFIKEYNLRYKATILLTSHYMRDVEQLCKRVIMIDNGKIIYDGNLSDIVKKYATKKILTIIFSKPIDENKIAKLGDIKSYEFPRVTISVEREKSNHIAAKLLEEFEIEDLNIEEIEIEEIMREIFAKGIK